MKYIEVIGGNFVNKGAELMLLSVLNEIQDWSMIPVVNLRMKSRRRCRELNIQRAGYFESHRASLLNAAFKTATSRVPKKLLRTAGIVKDGDITGILDISGFKYSDQQWQGACKLSGDRFARLKQNSNAKVVMMPQAFGPFESKRSALDFEAMVQHVDILYARDDVSFDHAINALGEAVHLKNKVRLAPDFTPVLRVKVNERSQKKCPIVPNKRMIDRRGGMSETVYHEILRSVIIKLQELDFLPYFLIHETEGDYEIASALNTKLTKPIKILQIENAFDLKREIGESVFLIGSRFHALVSALSQGVPALGTGWSHKYDQLFKSYNCSSLLLRESNPAKALEILGSLCDKTHRNTMEQRIAWANLEIESKIRVMWGEIRLLFGL